MKKRTLVALGALVLTLAMTAYADFNVLDKSSYYQNATNGAKVDASGNAYVTESAPAMDANLTFQGIINNTALTSGSGDSSAVLDTHRMRLGMLVFKIVPGTGNPGVTRLAVQVRLHLNGGTDSSSTSVIYFNAGKDAPAVVSAAADTANMGHQLTGSASAPWSGEFVVSANPNRNAPGNAAAVIAPWAYPNAIAVPLNNVFGREVWAPYISVRVRNIVGPTAAVTVHLVGTPL